MFNHLTREKRCLVLLLIPTILSTLAITQGDSTLAPGWVVNIVALINWFCFFLFLFNIQKPKLRRPLLLCVSVLYFLLTNFHTASGDIPMSGVLMFLLLTTFSFVENSLIVGILKYFRTYLIIMSIGGIIAMIDFSFGIGFPHKLVEYYGQNVNASYVNYNFAYLFVEFDGIRLCGLFNEPGALGTFLGLFLVLDHFNYKNKGNWVMFFAGILCFSLAFWVILFIGGILTAAKSWKTVLVFFILIGSIIYAIPYIHTNNTAMDYLIHRFDYNSKDGSFSGDNRKNDTFKAVEKEFDAHGNKIFGYGSGYCIKRGVEKTATYKSFIVEHGYLGFFLTYGLLLFSAYKTTERDRRCIILLICFALSIYQRPNVFSIAYYLILFGGIQRLLFEKSKLIVTK